MPAGRPKGTGKKIDVEEMKKWVRAGATIVECAARLRISVPTMNRRLALPEFREQWEEASAELKISLRSKQVAVALGGNPTMLIWLGKQYLGQTDKQEVSSGAGGFDVNVNVGAREILAGRIASIAARIRESGSAGGSDGTAG